MKYINALNTINGLGSRKMKQLIDFFGDSKAIWQANFSELVQAGIGDSIAQKIANEKICIDPEAEWKKLENENILAVSTDDPHYPELLKQIPDNPPLIYMKGNLDCLKMPLIAIVGSRKLTTYGKQVALGFSRDLANNGVCVVSGLAFGIDSAAHQGALSVKGKTIAVLGNSLDKESIAPRSNLQLSQDIINGGGLLISEFPLKTNATPGTFPARNRIMAGISQGTLVIEAALKSGSLITANLALDYNRDVFAVPGSIFSPQSEGTHHLIKAGAKITTSAKDVLEELMINSIPESFRQNQTITLNKEERLVVSNLSHESLHIDRISKLTTLDTSTISSILAILEIKGAVKNVGGQNYIRL